MTKDDVLEFYSLKVTEILESKINQDQAKDLLKLFTACVEKCKQPKAKRTPEDKEQTKMVWGKYVYAYRHRYKTEPPANAKNYSICAKLVGLVGFEQSMKLVVYYLRHADKRNRRHPLEDLLYNYLSYNTNLNKYLKSLSRQENEGSKLRLVLGC